MSKAYGVTTATKRLTGAQSRFYDRQGSQVGSRASNVAQRRLRGEMEHMSHEAAVSRYMTPAAKWHQFKVNTLFACAVTAGFAVIGAIALLFNFYF